MIINYKKSVKIYDYILLLLFAFIIAYIDLGNVLINISLTFLVLILVLLSSFRILLYKAADKNNYLDFTIIAIIFTYLICSLLWSRSYDYGLSKIILLLPFVIIAALLSDVILTYIKILKLLFLFISLYLIVDNIISKEVINQFSAQRLRTADETNPIKLGRYFGFMLINLYFLSLFYKLKHSFLNKLLKTILSVVFISIVFLTGSKGPLISLILTLITVVLPRGEILKKVFIFTITSLALWLIGGYLFNLFPSELQLFLDRRFNVLEDSDHSASSRLKFITYGLSHFSDRGILYIIIGNGIGDFKQSNLGVLYPHNIIVEILYELGLIGLGVFSFICIRLVLMLKAFYHLGSEHKYLVSSTVFFLYVSMTTGDIAGNSLFFMFFILSNNCYRFKMNYMNRYNKVYNM